MSKQPNPIDQHVGRQLRTRRILLEMTQDTLATSVGLTFQQIQKYEKGTNRIGASRLQEIAKCLNVPPSYFFEGSPDAGVHEQPGFEDGAARHYVPDALSTAEGLQLNRAFRKIQDPKVRRRIVDLVVQIAESQGGVSPARDHESAG